jgi:hypothetical protein
LCPARSKCWTSSSTPLVLKADRWLFIHLRRSPNVTHVLFVKGHTAYKVDVVVRATGRVYKNSMSSAGYRALITVFSYSKYVHIRHLPSEQTSFKSFIGQKHSSLVRTTMAFKFFQERLRALIWCPYMTSAILGLV